MVGERQTQLQWYNFASINSDVEKDKKKNIVSKLILVLNLKHSYAVLAFLFYEHGTVGNT